MKPIDLNELVEAPLVKLLAYGDSGSGKTHLVGTFTQCEDTAPVLVLNARGQPVSLRAFDPPPLVLTVETMKDFNTPYRWIDAGQPWEIVEHQHEQSPFFSAIWDYGRQFCSVIGEGALKFKTVAVDSITHVQRLALDAIVGNTEALPGDTLKSAQIQHWGAALSQLTKLADLYYRLPIHVILTALTRRDTIESMGVTLFCPFIWGQSSLEVPSHAEIVGRLVNVDSLLPQRATQIKRQEPKEFADAFNILLTRGGRSFMAKWQGVVNAPPMVIAPTAQKLIDIIKGA